MNDGLNSFGRQIDSLGRKFYLILGVALTVFSVNIILPGLLMLVLGISDREEVAIICGTVFIVLGISLLISGIILLFMHKTKEKNKRCGFYVDTQIVGYYIDYNRWGRGGACGHPYILVCRHFLENGQYQEYISEPVWVDPDYYVGRTVRVFSNSPNFFPYYVDLDSIPI